jgi:hypothetical protein
VNKIGSCHFVLGGSSQEMLFPTTYLIQCRVSRPSFDESNTCLLDLTDVIHSPDQFEMEI